MDCRARRPSMRLACWPPIKVTMGVQRLARAHYVTARLAALRTDYTVAERWHEQSRALAVDIGDQRLLANLLNSWGGLAHAQEDYPRAIQFHTEALALFR